MKLINETLHHIKMYKCVYRKRLRGCNNKTFYKSIVALDRTAVSLWDSTQQFSRIVCYQWKCSKVMITFLWLQKCWRNIENIQVKTLQLAQKTSRKLHDESFCNSMLFQFFAFASKHRKFHHAFDNSLILQAIIFPLGVMQFKRKNLIC